jgi:hypothetical protein
MPWTVHAATAITISPKKMVTRRRFFFIRRLFTTETVRVCFPGGIGRRTDSPSSSRRI